MGTARIVVNSSGSILDDSDFYPFGGERVVVSSSGNTYKFTAKERDTETGLDYFGARYHGSNMGRFMSPDDPKYSEKFEPQTWSLYTYVSNNPMSRVDLTGNNWFNVNNKWVWHDGNSWTDANGKTYKSDYTMLLRIQKTGQYTKDGAEVEKLTLLGHGEKDVLATGTGYTGNTLQGLMKTPNGNYEINLNIRGGPSSERVVWVNGQPTLGAFPGIQQLGNFYQNGKLYNAGGDWGDYRANLNGPDGPTHFYLHGKDDFFTSGRTYTHGCSTEPGQTVLRTIFKLDPSGVGEGAKNGRILVNVSDK